MTPTDYAAEELAMWQEALREQREAEEELAQLRRSRSPRMLEVIPQVEALTTRADLLLAEAVKVKCMFRDQARIREAGPTRPLD